MSYFDKLRAKASDARRNLAEASYELGPKRRNDIFNKSYDASLGANLNPYVYNPSDKDNDWHHLD